MDTQARGSRRESGEENLRVLFMFRCARRVVGCVEDRDEAFNGGWDNKMGRGSPPPQKKDTNICTGRRKSQAQIVDENRKEIYFL